jgi:hypothetical protein
MLGIAWLRGKARAMAETILEDMVKEKPVVKAVLGGLNTGV